MGNWKQWVTSAWLDPQYLLLIDSNAVIILSLVPDVNAIEVSLTFVRFYVKKKNTIFQLERGCLAK